MVRAALHASERNTKGVERLSGSPCHVSNAATTAICQSLPQHQMHKPQEVDCFNCFAVVGRSGRDMAAREDTPLVAPGYSVLQTRSVRAVWMLPAVVRCGAVGQWGSGKGAKGAKGEKEHRYTAKRQQRSLVFGLYRQVFNFPWLICAPWDGGATTGLILLSLVLEHPNQTGSTVHGIPMGMHCTIKIHNTVTTGSLIVDRQGVLWLSMHIF